MQEEALAAANKWIDMILVCPFPFTQMMHPGSIACHLFFVRQ